ncbi:CGNR zinc finger domain-containing protein [Dactylosporangium sp. NPDC048998]|uniref:CGNR zinc finger domain-containing protein n=1 Tax=Dactylosporangium sp. NPDC048998 TaxID=3363976 RepID=UPI00371F02AC
MLFAHDTELALVAAAATVNTGTSEELLPDVAALDAFLAPWNWTGRRSHDAAELQAVRALRPRLRRLWGAGEDEAAELVNAMLREADALPQLVKHDGWDYHMHATPPDADLHVRMQVEFAMAMLDVIRMKELDRLRVCAADDCDDVLVDLSKNRSRRFCEGGCGNRANAAAYRARRAARPRS